MVRRAPLVSNAIYFTTVICLIHSPALFIQRDISDLEAKKMWTFTMFGKIENLI